MKTKKRVLFIGIGCFIAVGVLLLLLLFMKETSIKNKVLDKNQTDVSQSATNSYYKEIQDTQGETKKAENFIVGMLANEDSLVDYHFEENHNETSKLSARESTLMQFLSVLETKDTALFQGIFESSAIDSAFSEEFNDYTLEGLENEYLRIINELTKNDTFSSGSFTFSGSKEGILTLNYKDDETYEVPFTLNEYEGAHGSESYYVIATPVLDILEKIK